MYNLTDIYGTWLHVQTYTISQYRIIPPYQNKTQNALVRLVTGNTIQERCVGIHVNE